MANRHGTCTGKMRRPLFPMEVPPMTRDTNDIVKVYSGPIELVETFQAELTHAGITSNVVGTELVASFGSALPGSTELWVHQSDLDRAAAIIEGETKPRRDRDPPRFPHPTDSPKPGVAPARQETWINPNG